jgi:polyhydroxyalkanoate synthesis regulator phasin
VIRKEIIKSLIAAGILTKEQLSAALDEAQREADEVCDNLEADNQTNKAREIVQQMRDATTDIVGNMRKLVSEPSS